MGEELLGVMTVGGIVPQLRVHREHHRVEVVATECLEVRGRGAQLVPGDPHPPAQALVPCRQDDLDRRGSRIELLEVGHGVELVQVEVVAVEPPQGLLQLGADSVGVVAQRLAGHEQPVTDGRDQGSDELLGPSVLRRHVEVVDPGGMARSKEAATVSGSESQKAAPPRMATDD